jgi:succinate dehydrogenase/fumarate reductase flavoprotein subunit
MGLQPLLEDGRMAGAVGLNVRTGELVVSRARAVIICAGGQSRLGLPNSGYLYGTFDYPGNTGDGFLFAYRAGAALTGMEHQMRPVLIKDANMPLLAITMTRGGRLLDIFDNILMENEFHNSMGIFNLALKEGRGPLRIRLSHLKPEAIDEIEHILFSTERPVQERFFRGRGVDFRKKDIELWPTEPQICGGHGLAGVMVNKRAETDVPGLYAAGDTASVPKQHLTGAFVFGEIAAEQAVQFIHSNPKVKVNQDQIDRARKQRAQRTDSSGKQIDVRELEYKVRRLIGDYVISPKNEYKLLRWGEWAKRFQEEINNDVRIRNGHELSKSYEVENIVHCASLSAAASLARKESRWGNAHLRTDYPDTDDKNWLCHVVLHRGVEFGDMKVGTKPLMGLDYQEMK